MKFLVLMWLAFVTLVLTAASDNNETYNLINSANLAKPGCETRCGDLIVPYPFGIVGNNSNCSISKGFDIYCNKSVNPPKATIAKRGFTRVKLISDSTVRRSNIVASLCFFLDGSSYLTYVRTSDLRLTPYSLSKVNKFVVVGCGSLAWLTSVTKYRNVSTGCMVFCSKEEGVVGGECSGNGCCQSSIPQDITRYESEVDRLESSRNFVSLDGSGNMSDTRSFAPCTYAFVGEENVFKFNGAIDFPENNVTHASFIERIKSTVPVVLDWAIGNVSSCAEAEAAHDFACQSNSVCVSSTRKSGGYRCECKQGFQGNPYLSPGCQDIDECSDVKKFPCFGKCVNTIGNYTCKCKGGYSGDAKLKDGCRSKPFNVLRLSLGLGFGFLTLLIGLSVLYLTVKQRKILKLREIFFEQNGGVLLEDKLKTTGGSAMKIFQVKELEKATNNYAEGNILGRGGNGTVYKGTLPDGRVIAIKKSQRLDQGQKDQFINEMVILTQINHRNVVQLLGCCLETDVPMLAYEFVSNDTLYRHIHNRASGKGRLSWQSRLRIAHESAGALAYLHTEARMPIIHRDVKSTNILLDDNYTAKIADFGASRLVPLGHEQVTTLVQGTIGYLDPEFFHTGHLTDKSDVYSFGVVFAELLTGKKPIDRKRDEEDINLATYFVKAKKENRLREILDHQVVNEATDEQLKAAFDLVCRCLNQVGENRPSMKVVAMELETLRKSGKHHPWSSEENSTEATNLAIESAEHDDPLLTASDTFGEYSESAEHDDPLLTASDTFGEYSSSTVGMK